MNQLIIHAGMPKTGTTYLQRYLRSNNEFLNNLGWDYPLIYSGNGINGYSTIRNFDAFHMLLDADLDEVLESNQVKMIQERIEKFNCIISSEGIFSLFENERDFTILRALRSVFSNIRIVIYLREQCDFIESIYAQYVEANGWTLDIKETAEKAEREWEWLKYDDVLHSLEKIFNHDEIIVRSYEGQDVVNDFFATIGIDLIKEENGIPLWSNPSLRMNYSQWFRTFNKAVGHDYPLYKEVSFLLQEHVCADLNRGEREQLPIDVREIIQQKFDISNRVVAREYCGVETLFRHKTKEQISGNNNRPSTFELINANTIATMIAAQRNTNRFLLYSRNKKIAFWGTGIMTQVIINTGLSPDLLIDNNTGRCSIESSIPIVHSTEFLNNCTEYSREDYIIVLSVMHKDFADELYKQCEEAGLVKFKDVFWINEMIL